MIQHNKTEGQVLLITVLVLGGSILGATTIAGLLLSYQIRQATDLVNSGKAIYAADAGLEWGKLLYFNSSTAMSRGQPSMNNGTNFTVTCFMRDQRTAVNCTDEASVSVIRSVGRASNVGRLLEYLIPEVAPPQ